MKLFLDWLNEIGVSPATGWRWVKKGSLPVEKINGRVYVPESATRPFDGLYSFPRWLKSVGYSARTGFRWEAEGKIEVRRVNERKFVVRASADQVAAKV